MAAASWFRYLYLAHVSRPKSVRQLYRLVKRRRVCRIVEVGISDLQRAIALIEVAQRASGEQPVYYTAIDWFEARLPELAPLSLKQAYRMLRATCANVRLMPGAPGPALAAAANAHQNTDLMLISPTVADGELERAWFYVPRMLHERSTILRESRDADARPVFSPIPCAQIAEWARDYSPRRAA